MTLTKQKGGIGGGISISMIIITSSIISTIIISLFSTPALLWLLYLRSASHYARAPASESWRGSFLSPNELQRMYCAQAVQHSMTMYKNTVVLHSRLYSTRDERQCLQQPHRGFYTMEGCAAPFESEEVPVFIA